MASNANTHLLLKANLKQLRLPTMHAEFEKLAREAAQANEGYEQYLLRLTELEVAARAANAVQTRIRQAGFPVPEPLIQRGYFADLGMLACQCAKALHVGHDVRLRQEEVQFLQSDRVAFELLAQKLFHRGSGF